ncbi:MAG: FHA domain-containing protein [Myxococcaceae bacterium]
MARLLIFNDAWEPERLELPDRPQLTIGFADGCDHRLKADGFEYNRLSLFSADIRLEREGAGWVLAHAGLPAITKVNGARFTERQRLKHEDVITVHQYAYVYEDHDEVRSLELEKKIARRPGDPGPVAVWADWLQEQRDPFGEQIALTARGDQPPPETACGFVDAYDLRVRVGFRDGLLDSIELRTAGDRQDVKRLLARLFHHRAARFLRTLRVDSYGMGGGVSVDELVPRLPSSLQNLDLGYSLRASKPVILTGQQQANLPELRQSVCFFAAKRALLKEGETLWPISDNLSIEMPPGKEVSVVQNRHRMDATLPDQILLSQTDNGSIVLRTNATVPGRIELNLRPISRAVGLLRNDELVIDNRRFRFVLE